jgi:hypothetical protein
MTCRAPLLLQVRAKPSAYHCHPPVPVQAVPPMSWASCSRNLNMQCPWPLCDLYAYPVCHAGLRIVFHHDLPGPQIPTALSFAPPLQYYKHAATQTLLLISDDSYKVGRTATFDSSTTHQVVILAETRTRMHACHLALCTCRSACMTQTRGPLCPPSLLPPLEGHCNSC